MYFKFTILLCSVQGRDWKWICSQTLLTPHGILSLGTVLGFPLFPYERSKNALESVSCFTSACFGLDDVCYVQRYRRKTEGNTTEIKIYSKYNVPGISLLTAGLNLVQRIKPQCVNRNKTGFLQWWSICNHVTIQLLMKDWKEGNFVTFVFFLLKREPGMLLSWEMAPAGLWLSLRKPWLLHMNCQIQSLEHVPRGDKICRLFSSRRCLAVLWDPKQNKVSKGIEPDP